MATFYGKLSEDHAAQAAVEQLPPPVDNAQEEIQPVAASAVIDREAIGKAILTLREYKDAKSSLEARIKEDEQWYRLRHWEVIRHKQDPNAPEPTSAWLFNAICAKHADAIDNFPETNVLPREQGDENEAKMMSSILPCVMEIVDFESVYDEQWWEKLKHGTGAYFVGWDPDAENGLGEHDIHGLDLMNCYWEPGISDIQESRNFFTVALEDTDLLEEAYPQYKGKFGTALSNDFKYTYDSNVKTEHKTLVVDWYTKVPNRDGRNILQYVKFAGEDAVLFSSADYTAPDGSHPYAEQGYYDHGLYPVVFDPLFPEKGTPIGFGLIAVTRSPQLYIDKLSANILEHSLLATKVRYIATDNCDINEDELKDANCVVVHSALSSLDENHIKEIHVPSLEGNYIEVLQMKIDELKETSANRDFSNGGTSSGVTAAAAIAALQESGNKLSRDMIQASYRADKKISSLVIENSRQFYDESRSFRITGEDGSDQYVEWNNSGIRPQVTGQAMDGTPLLRKPVFDLKIKPQKRSPFSQEAQYERAKELYGLGFFNPANAQQSLIALEMMEFEGKDKVRQLVQQGQTLYTMVQQLTEQLAMAQGIQVQQDASGGSGSAPQDGGGQTISQARQDAATANMTSYGQKLAKRSTPSMSGGNG